MTTHASLTLHAHAKLNLALAVGPPQPPKGYHPIASRFVAIELHDTLALQRLPDGTPSRFEIRWAPDAPKPTPIDWPIEKDLAVRAHAILEKHVGRALPIALTLDKRTPVGGGLGGGSSDAAYTLMGLNQLFDLRLVQSDLVALSAPLGSDIAFFLDMPATRPPNRVRAVAFTPRAPRPALVTGFGESIERLSGHNPQPVLLLIPPFGCPTGAVYQAFDRLNPRPIDEDRLMHLHASAIGGVSGVMFNDLAAPACMVQPRLGDILAALTPLSPLEFHITGSGSTLFTIPPSSSTSTDLAAIGAQIRAHCPGLVVVATTILWNPM